MKLKEQETSWRTSSALLCSQGMLLVNVVLIAWRKMLSTSRMRTDFEKREEKHLAMKLKEDKKSGRTSALLGSQERPLGNAVCTAWRKMLSSSSIQIGNLRGGASCNEVEGGG